MAGPPQLPGQQKQQASPSEILAVNLSMPGWGTVRAGQKLHGYLQLATAIVGFLLTLYFAAWFLWEWKRSGALPMKTLMETGTLPISWRQPLIVGGVGVLVFLLAMAWSFITSLVIMSRFKHSGIAGTDHR